jgi:formate hydrogenlyase subunit 4
MIHEGPLLEYAGRDLAYLQWASAARHWIMMVLAAQLFVPHPAGIWWQLGLLPVLLAGLCALVALVETVTVKMRVLRVPRLLAISSTLALLGITAQLFGLA